MNNPAPKSVDRLLSWFLKGELLEEILGDLHEYHDAELQDLPRWKRKLFYWFHVFNFLRPFALKRIVLLHLNFNGMYRNHFRMAVRSSWKSKGYTAINVLGLAIGISCFVAIMLFISDEWSFDRFHNDSDRIYRVAIDRVTKDGLVEHTAYSEPALLAALRAEVPEVETGTRICRNPWWGKALLMNGDQHYYDDSGLYVDSTFFHLFTFESIQGDLRTALVKPESIVITSELSSKLFGNANPIGKTVTLRHYQFKDKTLTVTAILKDLPSQSHFTFDYLVPIHGTLANVKWWREGTWAKDNTINTYFRVAHDTDLQNIRSKIQGLAEKNREENRDQYFVQPLAGYDGIHLSSHRIGELSKNSNITYLKALFIIGLFVLLIAIVNYINLTTARSSNRQKEVGLRKVLGAGRANLSSQFLCESVLVSVFAGLVSVLVTELSLDVINSILKRNFSLFHWDNYRAWIFLFSMALGVGLLAGFYPAFYLSSFKPMIAIRRLNKQVRGGISLRQVLVTFQFGISAILMIGVFVIRTQIGYMQEQNLGFDTDKIIVVKNFSNKDGNAVIRNKIAGLPGVTAVGATGQEVGVMDQSWLAPANVRNAENVQPLMWGAYIDQHYLDVMGIEIIRGRNFSHALDNIPQKPLGKTVILNETAIRKLEVPEPVIGQKIEMQHGGEYEIVGVTKDFHATSLHDEILPMAFVYTRGVRSSVAIKLAGGNIGETIKEIEATWSEFVPDLPLDYYFLDHAVQNQYRLERDFRRIFGITTGLSLLIACLGLFGLAAFLSERRSKEISVRKVLGASITQLLTVLGKEFLILVGIANVIAWPVAYIVMDNWLANFAYHINVSWKVFLLTGAVALAIAIFTVSFHTYRSAIANPVDSLRDE